MSSAFRAVQRRRRKSKRELRREEEAKKYKVTPYADDIPSQRAFFDLELVPALGITHPNDWYGIRLHTIARLGGAHILQQHENSVQKTLQNVYPEVVWQHSKFVWYSTKPLFDDKYNHRLQMNRIAKHLGYKVLDDYYDFTCKQMIELGASSILLCYNSSVTHTLKELYPQHNWIEWNFRHTPKAFFKDKAAQKRRFDELAQTLNLKVLDDWYKVTQNGLDSTSAHRIVQRKYGGSFSLALSSLYENHDWVTTRFRVVPRGHWKSEKNIKEFLYYVEEKYKIRNPDEWYRITNSQLRKAGGKIMTNTNLYPECLRLIHPNHDWVMDAFKNPEKKGAQRVLFRCIRDLFPKLEVIEEANLTAILDIGITVLADIFVPDLKLIFEYQGEHHYGDSNKYGPSTGQQTRDADRRSRCQKRGLTIINIPYWWEDGDMDTLSATIVHYRPDIQLSFQEGVKPLLD
mmetsp:Transcript_6923/g.7591  ORF Transcript_6923/g.7591 Transcript_6923/m.7591 type:complete len:459 (-) Transcript_6923:50-1426(-)